MMPRQPARHHEIRPPPLLPIRHLAGKYGGNLARLHPPPPPEARCLHRGGRRDHDHAVHPPFAPRLEQQRNVQHRYRPPGSPCAREKHPFGLAHQGMQNRLEPGQPTRLSRHHGAQANPIHGTTADRAGKRRSNRRNRLPAQRTERMHGAVGIEHRDAGPAKDLRHRRFAHPHAPGEPDHPHRRLLHACITHFATKTAYPPGATWARPRSRTRKSKTARSTDGVTPNQTAKPGTAWCTSIPRPPTVRRPRARAAARSGVSSGT